uniref:Sodium channel protein Nach n=1 Tax=Bursaphelenchus xylophilus TaxID=6326 RepID=A0A1I7S9N6_BURXY
MTKKHSKNCPERYLWRYELHGLSQVIVAKTLTSRIVWVVLVLLCLLIAVFFTDKVVKFKENLGVAITFIFFVNQLFQVCPKNPDAINMEAVKKEIRSRFIFTTEKDTIDLISFAIAGSGLANMEPVVSQWTMLKIQRLNSLLLRWKGDRNYTQFYNDLFFKNGYKCEDMFHSCFIGYDEFDCCEKFRPQYVMLRGKCFRMQQHFQTDPDYHGRVALQIKQLPSPIVESSKLQPQAVIFCSDNDTDISTFPRFYVNMNESIFVRFVARFLRMSPWESECSMLDEDKGRATCYVKKYHEYRVLNPLNCSLFYLKHRAERYEVCAPLDIVYNYNVVVNGALGFIDDKRCLPHCNRWYYEFKITRSEISLRFQPKNTTFFRFESGFADLKYELYEEIRTTTLPGFVSQIGGQSGLFLGFSVMTLVQFFLLAFRLARYAVTVLKKRE